MRRKARGRGLSEQEDRVLCGLPVSSERPAEGGFRKGERLKPSVAKEKMEPGGKAPETRMNPTERSKLQRCPDTSRIEERFRRVESL